MSLAEWKNISGEPYDWKKTKRPEREYVHDYTKTYVYKIFCCERDGNGNVKKVSFTFEEVLEIIRKVDMMTLGMPKIVYLVGWQYSGHDSKYPAWDGVNEALKRDCDETALESLRWLMAEGYRYNTTVSLHINMTDAYMDSPLWDRYVERDVLIKNEDGSIYRWGSWGGMSTYIVSPAREWEEGLAQERIDRLCGMLPIREAGTVHIDAFLCREDKGHGLRVSDQQTARRKIFRYWRSLGIDVTSEFLYTETDFDYMKPVDDLIGIQPLAWHFAQYLNEYMERPASLVCGVNANRGLWYVKGWEGIDMAGLFGISPNLESQLKWHAEWEKGFLNSVFRDEFRSKYLMSLDRLSAKVTGEKTTVYFSDGVEVSNDGRTRKNGVVIQNGRFSFYPLVASKTGRYEFFAVKKGSHSVKVGKAFGIKDGEEFDVAEVTPEGISGSTVRVRAENGALVLTAEHDEQAFVLL